MRRTVMKRVMGKILSAILVLTLVSDVTQFSSFAGEAAENPAAVEEIEDSTVMQSAYDLTEPDSTDEPEDDSLTGTVIEESNNIPQIKCIKDTVSVIYNEEGNLENSDLDLIFEPVIKVHADKYISFKEGRDEYKLLKKYLRANTSEDTGSDTESDEDEVSAESLVRMLADAAGDDLEKADVGTGFITVAEYTDEDGTKKLFILSAVITEAEKESETVTEDETEATVTEDEEPTSSEEDTDDEKPKFTIDPGTVMYGESGDNSNGVLDELFKPSYFANGQEYVLKSNEKQSGSSEDESSEDGVSGDESSEGETAEDETAEVKSSEVDTSEDKPSEDGSADPDLCFTASYKFITGELQDEISAEDFDKIESEDLSSIPAGEEVTVIALASSADQPDTVTSGSFVMEKRKILVHFETPEEIGINEKSDIEDDKLVFDEEEAVKYITVEVVENGSNPEGTSTFARPDDEEITPEAILDGEVTLDVSEVDYDEVGLQEVPMLFAADDKLSGNYEVSIEPVGYVYVDETRYTITFSAKNDGLSKELTYVLDQDYVSPGRTIKEVLNNLGVLSEVYPTMGGLINTERGDSIVTWRVTVDAISQAYNMTPLDPEFKNYYSGEDYKLSRKTDYYLTANVCRKASENIYIDSLPAVIYNGLPHVSHSAKASKSASNDLGLTVKYVEDGTNEVLRYGTDYKVKYKNNKNASVYMTPDGEYKPLYTEEDGDLKRPCAVVTGIGNYKGFSATVYFDILPADLGDYPVAQISGLKYSYVLKSNGKLSSKISPTVKIRRSIYTGKKYVYKTYSLKSGKDYETRLYIYEDDMWKKCDESNPNKISKEGKYLFMVRGIGNYCGSAFGQDYDSEFRDGSDGSIPNPEVCSYVGTDIRNCQFIVIGDTSQDLAKATVTVKKTKLNYRKSGYTADDFGIKVTIGKGSDKRVLTEGKDYYVTFDGTDFPYVYKKERVGGSYVYHSQNSSEVYEGGLGIKPRIYISNKYSVRITAIEGNDNGLFGGKNAKSVRIKGIRINPKWFKLTSPSLKYNGRDETNGFNSQYNSYRMNVVVRTLESVMSFNSDGYSNYDSVKNSMLYNAIWISHSHYNKNPGTYVNTIWPVGPGVDHDYVPTVKFKRSGITTKEAISKGILRISYDSADYNAGGALPKNIVVTLNGYANHLGDMTYNGMTSQITDNDGDHPTTVNLKFTVSNNKKTGNSAGLYIQGDGKVFKGKSKKLKFSVDPITVSDITIPVLTGDSYIREYGKTTNYVPEYVSDFYAQYEPVIKPSRGNLQPKITLYQAYYKNGADLDAGRMSLAKIGSGQYKLLLTENGTNNYSVMIGNSKAKIITGYDFNNVALEKDYTIYDSSATIVGAKVSFNGEEYDFPADSKRPLPFKGGQIRFDKNPGDGVISVTLKDGTVLDADNFTVEYGNNNSVGTGKKGGSFTVILKRNSGAGTYQYGGRKTFYFTITGVDGIVI